MGAEAVLSKPKEPTKKYPVTCDDIAAMKEVGYVFSKKGKYPDIIVIGQFHPDQNRSMDIRTGETQTRQSMERIGRLCSNLYDRYGVKSIILEGLPPSAESVYGKMGSLMVARHPGTNKLSSDYYSWIENLLNTRRWNLKSGEFGGQTELEAQQKDINEVCAEFRKTVDRILEESMMATGKIKNGAFIADETKFRAVFQQRYAQELAKARMKMDAILTPKRMDELYQYMVSSRERRYIEQCEKAISEGKGPVIAIIGSSHMKTFSEAVGKNHSYVTVCPLNPLAVNAATGLDKQVLKESFLAKLEGDINFNVKFEFTKDGKIKVSH